MTTMEQSIENPANIRGVCFCCLADGSFKNMYQSFKWIDHSEVYADMMLNCYNISIGDVARDTKPLICEVCIVRLRDSLAFRKQVENSCEVMKNATSLPETNVFELPIQKWEGDEEEDSFNWDDTEAREDSGEDLPLKIQTDDKRVLRIAVGRLLKDDLRTTGKSSKVKSKSTRSKRTRDKDKPVEKKPKLIKKKLIKSEPRKQAVKKEYGLLMENVKLACFRWRDGKFVCAVCNEKCQRLPELNDHAKTHQNEDMEAMIRKTYRSGQILYMDITMLECIKCSDVFTKSQDFKDHIIEKHKANGDRDFWGIIKAMKGDKSSFECHVCNKTFIHFLTLSKHMNSHADFKCKSCEKSFINWGRLKRHTRRMHNVGEFLCKKCDLPFDGMAKLDNHIKAMHKKPVGSHCPRCSLVFPSFIAKMRHLVEAHNEEPNRYKCDICPKGFMTSSKLSAHKTKVHLRIGSHICEVCGRGFLYSQALTRHSRTHTGEKPYLCTVCQKRFPRSYSLKEHMKIHNNIRKFSCNICGMAFIQNCSLKSHMKTHESRGEVYW